MKHRGEFLRYTLDLLPHLHVAVHLKRQAQLRPVTISCSTAGDGEDKEEQLRVITEMRFICLHYT